MKTKKNQLEKAYGHVIDFFMMTSSFTAKIIGPTVFNCGTNKQSWNISTKELLLLPEGSVGNELGKYLKEQKLEPLEKAEYHDVQHILFDFSMSFVDEVALQFFLIGNGKKSIASISTYLGAWFILPTKWKYLKTSYQRGKKCKDTSILNVKTILNEDFGMTKNMLFSNSSQIGGNAKYNN